MIVLVGLFALFVIVYVLCTVFGVILAVAGNYMSKRYKQQAASSEPPSHVNLLTPPKPYDWETDLEGWDGGDELDLDEEL